MSRRCHTKTEGLSGAPLFGPSKNYIGVVTNARSVVREPAGNGPTPPGSRQRPGRDNPGVTSAGSRTTDLSAELALGWGEGEPADAGKTFPAKAPRSAGDPFDLAAVLCGHDPTTCVGAADARHDHRVWDLLEVSR